MPSSPSPQSQNSAKPTRSIRKRITRGILWLSGGCLCIYALLAARYFLPTATLSHNYAAELNAEALKAPESERGWPLYLKAMVEFGPAPEIVFDTTDPEPRRPSDAGWPKMVEWLESHRGAFETLRAAAAKPVLGALLRADFDPELVAALKATGLPFDRDVTKEKQSQNPLLFGVLLPQLGEFRRMSRWLAADAHRAASLHDAETFTRDIAALLGIASHARQQGLLIGDLVSLAIADLAFTTIKEELATPGVWSEPQLAALAHSVAAFEHGRFSIDPNAESLMVLDLLQRFYTDDGRGDGHAIRGQSDELIAEFGVELPRLHAFSTAADPIRALFAPSRAEAMRLVNEFGKAAKVDDARPPWEHHLRTCDRQYARMFDDGPLRAASWYVAQTIRSLMGFTPESGPIKTSLAARDRLETSRSATLVALAAARFRLARGSWPGSLAELSPDWLAAMPLDPFTGQPLKFKPATDANPMPTLYSIGSDGVDDGGTTPATDAGIAVISRPRETVQAARTGISTTDADAKGDWVLWPLPAGSRR